MTNYKKLADKLDGEACGSRTGRKAAAAIRELLQLHHLDQSEIVLLRRQIQALMEEREVDHA